MPINLLVFDLDGTLIDSELDLALAVNATRANAHMEPLDHETIYSFVGNGAPTLIQRALGPKATKELAEESLQFFYAYYREHMLDHTHLYAGVREALDDFRAGGKKMAVLTNKPVRFSTAILEGLGVGDHFHRVYGGNSFVTKKPDPEGLNFLMDELDTPKNQALMVGDSAVDVETARNAEILSCGVTYGLQPETFEQLPPDILVDRLDELVPIVNAQSGVPSRIDGLSRRPTIVD